MTQVHHKHPESRPLAAAHSPTAIPAENQAPKIALRLSPRRCSKARQSWPGFRPATLLPFWNLLTGFGLAMSFASFAYSYANDFNQCMLFFFPTDELRQSAGVHSLKAAFD